jgi:hypothetical protein
LLVALSVGIAKTVPRFPFSSDRIVSGLLYLEGEIDDGLYLAPFLHWEWFMRVCDFSSTGA